MSSYFDHRSNVFQQLGLREEALSNLKSYIELLWQSNEELNLISRKMTFEELIDNHVIDCLLPLKHFPLNIETVADLGTGGGLPAVILAIQYPEVKFHLFEKSKLKQDFLIRCRQFAPNLNVCGEIQPKLPIINLVTARAFKPIDTLLNMTRDHFENGGNYFLLKGRKAKIEEELTLAKRAFKGLSARVMELKSPVLDVERNLVLIQKL